MTDPLPKPGNRPTDPSPIREEEAGILVHLKRYIAERAERDRSLRTTYSNVKAQSLTGFRQAKKELKHRIESELSRNQQAYEELQRTINSRFEQSRTELQREEDQKRRSAQRAFETQTDQAQKQFQQSQWESQTAYSARRTGQKQDTRQRQREIESRQRRMEQLRRRGIEFLDSRNMARLSKMVVSGGQPEPTTASPMVRLDEILDQVDAKLASADRLFLPSLVGPRIAWIFVVVFLVLASLMSTLYPLGIAIITSAFASLIVGVVLAAGLHVVARRLVADRYRDWSKDLASASEWVQQATAQLADEVRHERHQTRRRYRKEAHVAEEAHRQHLAELAETRTRILLECDEQYPRRMAEITQERDDALRAAQLQYPPRLRELKATFEGELSQIESSERGDLDAVETRYLRDWDAFVAWCQEQDRVLRDRIARVHREGDALFPGWDSPVWPDHPQPVSIPSSIRLGELRVPVDSWLAGTSAVHDDVAGLMPPSFMLPALASFPTGLSTLWLATGDGLKQASHVLSNTMLRLLTSLPAGKARLTVIDPVGLGQDFAAFMHLTDFDDAIAGPRIWTEAGHIEQRLVDLTEHMENVIQKYLRNQYPSIEAYNAEAGEIAEPYRVLVISRFPTNFNEGAIRRLVSILSSGSPCGVFVLMSVDSKQPLPPGVTLQEIERLADVFKWTGSGFRWSDAIFGPLELVMDDPPSPERMMPILGVVGQRAKLASRVEVPFRVVVGPEAQWWRGDSRREISVPIGRSGATKLQWLSLGSGTSQHVLIAGKTGSGKSTLLHALITSAALQYSPRELSLYLIDFKKGVEFKTYVSHALPHARVIAIESEREFGLSVMQRLDEELQARGDVFRRIGVQDIGSYRDRVDQDPTLGDLPRILFIVDEFQEFFVVDDKISQQSALLLDRLVRQGRAFGIHVLLGSQTLGGAYSLARSTLGQMAVRIALQCSETDAHLILSEDNTAARLLSRPGEAIYNDANGTMEGNNPFQVVWLPDDEKDRYLDRVVELAGAHHLSVGEQIVFEGNAPARLDRNVELSRRVAGERDPRQPIRAWLGEPVEIREPTAVDFQRQSGANLLILGQGDETATGLLMSAVVSLAYSSPPGTILYHLDGTQADTPTHNAIAELAARLPLVSKEITRRSLTDSLCELQELLHRRQLEESADVPVFLVVADLGRLRDLRRGEDDFGFSSASAEETPRPDKILANLIKDGPAVGIHTLISCDNLANLQRAFDRTTMRELGLRVLLQMSSNDSSSLVDSPIASRLGPNRALLHLEDLGRIEKFRPYGLPSGSWIALLPSVPSTAPAG